MNTILAAAATVQNTGTPTWVIITVSIVGGGVVGSLVSTYITSSREGRQARAKVRECLFDTENTRWTDADYKEFRQAISRLEATALIAKAPREIIRRYVYLAEVAHYTQLAKEKADPGYPPRGLPVELAGLVEMTLAILIVHLWRPFAKRLFIKRGIWIIDGAIEATKRDHSDFTWNVQLLHWKAITKEPGIIGVIHRLTTRRKRMAVESYAEKSNRLCIQSHGQPCWRLLSWHLLDARMWRNPIWSLKLPLLASLARLGSK